MRPWDPKIRWQLGGNLQPVRMICEIDWRSCPYAILNYLWSEVVTDVIDCLSTEGVSWRMILLILVILILLRILWIKLKLTIEHLISQQILSRVELKLQSLELRINVLAYRMQYGAWPLPQGAERSAIANEDHDFSMPVFNSSGNHSWLNYFIPNYTSKSKDLELQKEKLLRESSKRIGDSSVEMKELYTMKYTNRTDYVTSDKLSTSDELTQESCEETRQFAVLQRSCREKQLDSKSTRFMNTSSGTSKLFSSTKENLVKVRQQLENLHTVLRTYGNEELKATDENSLKMQNFMKEAFEEPDESKSYADNHEKSPEKAPSFTLLKAEIVAKTNDENSPVAAENCFKDQMSGVTIKKSVEKIPPTPNNPADAWLPTSNALSELNTPEVRTLYNSCNCEETEQKSVSSSADTDNPVNDIFTTSKNNFQMQILDIIPEELSCSSSCEQGKSTTIHAKTEANYTSCENSHDLIAKSENVNESSEESTSALQIHSSNFQNLSDVFDESLMKLNDATIILHKEQENAKSFDESNQIMKSLGNESSEISRDFDKNLQASSNTEIPSSPLPSDDKQPHAFNDSTSKIEESVSERSLESSGGKSSQLNSGKECTTTDSDLKKSNNLTAEADTELLIDVPCFTLRETPSDHTLEEAKNSELSYLIDVTEEHVDIDYESDLIILNVDDVESKNSRDCINEEASSILINYSKESKISLVDSLNTPSTESLDMNILNELIIQEQKYSSPPGDIKNTTVDASIKSSEDTKSIDCDTKPEKTSEMSSTTSIKSGNCHGTVSEEFIEKIIAPADMMDIMRIESPEALNKNPQKIAKNTELNVTSLSEHFTCGKNQLQPNLSHDKPLNFCDKSATRSAEKQVRDKLASTTNNPGKVVSLKKMSDKSYKKTSIKTRSNVNLTNIRDDLDSIKNRNLSKSNTELSQRRSKSYATPRRYESPRILRSSRVSRESTDREIEPFNTSTSLKSNENMEKTRSKSGIPVLKAKHGNPRDVNFARRAKSPLRSHLTMSTNSRESESIQNLLNENPNKGSTGVRQDTGHVNTSAGQTVIYVNIVTEQERNIVKVVDPRKFLDYVRDRAFKIPETGEYAENPDASKILTVVSTAVNEDRGELEDTQMPEKSPDTSIAISYVPKYLYLSEEV